jgi:hypothetical protein
MYISITEISRETFSLATHRRSGDLRMPIRLHMAVVITLLSLAASVRVQAGSAVIGSVAGTVNATLDGQTLLPNSVVFNGDRIQVRNGVVVLALDHDSRVALGRDSVAGFVRDSTGVTVVVKLGDVSIFHPATAHGIRVKVDGTVARPLLDHKSLSEVAVLAGMIVVTAKEGPLDVSQNGKTVRLEEGRTIFFPRKTVRSQQNSGARNLAGSNTGLEAGAVGTGGLAAILSGIALSRANGARSAASEATSAADQAISAASTASSAANLATLAAEAAQETNNLVGCAINNWGADLGITGQDVGVPSPYSPPSGMACPPNPSGVN